MAWESAPQVGSVAPEFELTNQHGERVAARPQGHGSVLLFFYPYAFTGVCTREIRGLGQRRDAFTDADCRVLAISTDTMFTLRVFDDTEGLGLDLLSDHWPHGQAAQRYGSFDDRLGCARRASFLISADGLIAWRTLGELPQTRDLDAHVDAARSLIG